DANAAPVARPRSAHQGDGDDRQQAKDDGDGDEVDQPARLVVGDGLGPRVRVGRGLAAPRGVDDDRADGGRWWAMHGCNGGPGATRSGGSGPSMGWLKILLTTSPPTNGGRPERVK